MKKINIEEWERKVPELPENFFEEMQEKVLVETIYKKETKGFKLSWVWPSVAVVAVFFGMIFFTKKSQQEQGVPVIAMSEIESREEIVTTQRGEIVEGEEIFPHQAIEVVSITPRKKLVLRNIEKKLKYDQGVERTKREMENILNAMSEEDLKDLVGNYEQDVYLELY